VELGGVRGFVPFSQMELGGRSSRRRVPSAHFPVPDLEGKGKEVVLSRAALLRRNRNAFGRRYSVRIEEDWKWKPEVVRVRALGLFVDVGGGLHALVPAGNSLGTAG